MGGLPYLDRLMIDDPGMEERNQGVWRFVLAAAAVGGTTTTRHTKTSRRNQQLPSRLTFRLLLFPSRKHIYHTSTHRALETSSPSSHINTLQSYYRIGPRQTIKANKLVTSKQLTTLGPRHIIRKRSLAVLSRLSEKDTYTHSNRIAAAQPRWQSGPRYRRSSSRATSVGRPYALSGGMSANCRDRYIRPMVCASRLRCYLLVPHYTP